MTERKSDGVDGGEASMEEPIAAPPRSGPKRVTALGREYDRTIYSEASEVLNDVLCAALDRTEDAALFAQAIDLSGDFRKLWSASLLCDRFGISPSTLAKWRVPEFAPRPVMRREALKELRVMLAEALSRPFELAVVPELGRVHDLAGYGRRAIARELLRRLASPGAAHDDLVFATNLRMALDLGDFCSAAVLSEDLGFSPSSLSRWSAGEHLPKTLVRNAVISALRDALEAGLNRRPSTPV